MDVDQLRAIFPKTSELLDEMSARHLKEHFRETAKKDLLVLTDQDQSRWFPVFLKLQGIVQNVLEVAEFEYIKHSVRTSDVDEIDQENDIIRMNPSVQFVELHYDQPKLGRQIGLYCFFKKGGAFYEFQLGLSQALILDLLQEGRKYSQEQVVELAMQCQVGPRKQKKEWQEIVSQMISVGILIG